MKRLLLFLTAALSLYAADATPVSISGVTRSSNVATVTCSTTCGIAANQGFCILGVTGDTSLNVCATASAGSGTTFSFASIGSNGTIGAGGTAQPAREVIVLSTINQGVYLAVSYLLWNTTQQGLVNSALTSQWNGTLEPPALFNQELQALKNGTTIETVRAIQFPNTYSKAQIQAFLLADWQANQTNLSGGVQPAQYYGQNCDPVGCSF